jgi:hypothetical protein
MHGFLECENATVIATGGLKPAGYEGVRQSGGGKPAGCEPAGTTASARAARASSDPKDR